MSANAVIFCHHDSRLVVLSILISILAAFAARELVGRINEAQGRVWLAWLAGASVVDGIGTCSMHYTGKLACHLPMPLLLDWRIVLLSLFVAISGTAASLFVVGRRKFGWGRALLGSILLGGWGVSALHYVSMAAIVQPAPQHYSLPFVIAAVLLAIAVVFGAIILAFRFPVEEGRTRWRKHASSTLRGMANPVMHYTAMAGVTFGSGGALEVSHAVGIWSIGVAGISIVPVIVLGVGLLTSFLDTVKKSHAQLRALTGRLVTVREEEAKRIAREIHDEMGQALTALKLDAKSIEDQLRQNERVSNYETVYERLNAMSLRIDSSVEMTRRICAELRPGVFDQLGLVAALEWQTREFESRTGIFCNLSLPEEMPELNDQHATTIFRIFQEVLTNIARHAEASEVHVQLEQTANQVILTVKDNGRGISEEEAQRAQGLGLLGMRERAVAAGGDLRIQGKPGSGTTVILRLPA
jgi:signal transduction histidine kinase